MPLSFLARPEKCRIGNQRREGGSVTKVVTISRADQNGTLTTKSNYFEAACFLSDNGRCMLPRFRHKTSTVVREECEGEMNKRKLGSFVLCAMLFALCSSAEAQQANKVPRIGYLSPTDAPTDSARAEAIRLALRELGHIEGQNIITDYRYAEGKLDRLPDLAAELVRLKVDIIVVGGDIPTRAAKKATKTIPIVMMGTGSDPVEAGLVENLARPGGNVTGRTTLNRELGGEPPGLLKEAVPKVARVAVLYDPAVPDSVLDVKEVLPVAARALK